MRIKSLWLSTSVVVTLLSGPCFAAVVPISATFSGSVTDTYSYSYLEYLGQVPADTPPPPGPVSTVYGFTGYASGLQKIDSTTYYASSYYFSLPGGNLQGYGGFGSGLLFNQNGFFVDNSIPLDELSYDFLLNGSTGYFNNIQYGPGYTSTNETYIDYHDDFDLEGVQTQFYDANGNPIGAVPEVSTWFMMMLGFCGLGILRQRNRASLRLR